MELPSIFFRVINASGLLYCSVAAGSLSRLYGVARDESSQAAASTKRYAGLKDNSQAVQIPPGFAFSP
eukprot:2812780-Pleurochrysis_carterae.AAC.2